MRVLLDRWRREAETLRRHGAGPQADALDTHIRDVEEALSQQELERLTIREAAKETGFSESQLRRIFRGQQTVSRGALPRKPHLKAG